MYTENEIVDYAYDLAEEWGNYFDEQTMSYSSNRGAVLFFYPDVRELESEFNYLDNFTVSFPMAEVDVDLVEENIQTRNRSYGRYEIIQVNLRF
jgi:hypothetical protein